MIYKKDRAHQFFNLINHFSGLLFCLGSVLVLRSTSRFVHIIFLLILLNFIFRLNIFYYL